MTSALPDYLQDLETLPRMPAWVGSGRAETLCDAAFCSGAALAHLHIVLHREAVPQNLLRARLALQAAEVCVGFSGRPERAGDLRDAVHLLRPGDLPGPAGEIYLTWRRAIERRVSIKVLHRVLPQRDANQIAVWMDAGQGGPVARSASVLAAVLTQDPRAETDAVLLADAALSQALGWSHVVPLLSFGLKRADLRKREADLQHACHRAATASAAVALQMAADLGRKAARLNAIAPKLRAKGAGAAVEMFLTRDAVAPAALTSLNSDRAARRFCDRMVALGVARELTGRDSFRLYGV